MNEDANSSLYTIDPDAWQTGQIQPYSYSEALPHHGGTDAISVDDGQLLISASAPVTTGAAAPNPAYPAVYTVSLDQRTHVATVHPLFSDEAQATVANSEANSGAGAGKTVRLALTDPDSSEVVPYQAPRFRGDFMLTSQGDQEQIYVTRAGIPHQALSVLSLSESVDDTAWAGSWHGWLYATDNGADKVDVLTGWSVPGPRSSPSRRAVPTARPRPARRPPPTQRTTSAC